MSRLACLMIAAWALAVPLRVAAATPPMDWSPLDAAVSAQIAAGKIPGAVAVMGDAENIWLRRAWGSRAQEPDSATEPMTVKTVFDLASLTKVVCTTTAVLQLVERGRLQLDTRVAQLWPAFAANGKQDITVGQLLSHSSGLPPGLSWAPREDGAKLEAKVTAQGPVQPPGSVRIYSDVGFIVLGLLVQRVSGEPLDRYCRRHIFAPLAMHDTGFKPSRLRWQRVAPTEREGDSWLRGRVQDPMARRVGGVAGHAGLFGTADDLALFAQALLRGRIDAPLQPGTIAALQRPHGPTAQPAWQGLGWELQPPFAAEREGLPPLGAIGHTGYTGTGLWIDFVTRRFVVLLSSRLQLQGGDARPLRRHVLALVSSLEAPVSPQRLVEHDAAFAPYLQQPLPGAEGPVVRTGIDVLRDQGYAALAGRRVGLITNLSAIDRHGWRTLDRLRWAPGVTLVRVFTPEHGLFADVEGRVPSGIEPLSGLPLVSLYGDMQRPTPESLQGLDTLVFDVQDAGARFFTYISTLGQAMEAAATAGLRVVVLDRPNPIRGDRVSGPMLDASRLSFTGYAPMPVQHGMTVGEVARWFQARLHGIRGIDVDLQVIPMQGWRRGMWFDQTGLDWVPPSPNLRRLATAVLYPGAAWVEGANLSVGRGTDRPFEWIGAPWIDGNRWVRALNALGLPGVVFRPVHFTPLEAAYRGRLCAGVELSVTDRERFDASLLGAALVRTLQELWPGTFRIDSTLGMVGSASTLEALRQGADLGGLSEHWAQEREAFLAERERALLYGER